MSSKSSKRTSSDNSDIDDPLPSTKRCTTPKKTRQIRNELTKEERSRTFRKLFNHAWLQDDKFKN